MDPPTNDVELVPEKEKIEDGKEGCPSFHCDLCDTEVVHKVAEVFLPGLAAACIDNTTGGIFSSPASVAVDLRKEMIEYLTMRSENFVAESVILEGDPNTEISDQPYDIISDFVDDFASSKRNIFSRVSGWLLSEKREDKVDDFVQEMETNGFWLKDRRETIAKTLIKNVDFKNICHCDKKFNTAEELAEHAINCDFRSMDCTNEGCNFVYCARHMEKHDSACPFKIIPCEQKCSEFIMRREMDRHCITVCPMKLVNCPFYGVGCQSTIPRCMIQQHCSDEIQLHLTYALKNIHKGATEGDLKKRANQILELSSGQLQGTRDARSLTLRVKDLDAKLGPLEISSAEKALEESSESTNDNIVKSSEPANDNTEKLTERASDSADKSVESASDNGDKSTDSALKFSENAIENVDKSSEPASDNAVKSIESASDNVVKFSEHEIDNADTSTESANENAHKFTEPARENAAKLSECAIDNADMSTEPASNIVVGVPTKDDVDKSTSDTSAVKFSEYAIDNASKSTEPASDNTNKSTELARDNANKSTECVTDKAYKFTEHPSDDGDEPTGPASYNANRFNKSIEPENDNAVEFSEHAIDSAEKSTEPVSDNADKSIEPTCDNAEKSTEPASVNVRKSTETTSDDAEKSIDSGSDSAIKLAEPSSNETEKSAAPAIDNANKSTESSEDGNGASQRPTKAPNKVMEESV